MRHPGIPRKMADLSGSGFVRSVLAVAAAATLSACSGLGGELDVTGATADDLAWAFARTAELETEVAQLSAENTKLTKRVADLESAKPAPATEAKPAEDVPNPPKPVAAAPAVKPEQVVGAAQATRALAGAPAADGSPKLVQPSFASLEETVFENEAATGDIPLSSVLFGVHLASYREAEQARAGWRKLQRENPDELGLLEPRIEKVSLEARGDFLRLVGGGFSSETKASALCAKLKSKGVFCSVTSFDGERLSLSERS